MTTDLIVSETYLHNGRREHAAGPQPDPPAGIADALLARLAADLEWLEAKAGYTDC